MNIHEHQAKQILSEFGAPIAKGATITKLDQAEAAVASLPGPVWVVKVKSMLAGAARENSKSWQLMPKAVYGYLSRLKTLLKISVKYLAKHWSLIRQGQQAKL